MSRTDSVNPSGQLDYDPYANYHHLPHSASSPHAQQYASLLEGEKELPSAPVARQGSPLAYYPLSTSIIALWIGIVAVVVTLLERSVAVAPTAVRQPWYYSHDGLPNVLLTIFTQAHGPVTAMHLARLAISGLQSSDTSPRTWMELFWLADKSWQGPVGMLTTAWSVAAWRVRVSQTFITFSFISLVALITPVILNRAYPVQTIDVRVAQKFTPSTLSAERFGNLDAYSQLAAGGGTWATDLTVFDLFNSTTYTQAGVERGAGTGDFFFTGDVQGRDVTLPGLRVRGSCHAVSGQSGLGNLSALQQVCQQEFPGTLEFNWDLESFEIYPSAISLNVSYCITTPNFNPLSIPSNTSALVWFDTQNNTGMFKDTIVQGLVRCDSYLTTGNATIDGRSLTFDSFTEDPGFYNSTQGGEPLLDPLDAALYHLYILGQTSQDALGAQAVDIFGFAEVDSMYDAPSLDAMAAAMWRGTSHMTAAVAILGRASDTPYPAVEYVSVSARTRSGPFFAGALALLALWLAGLVYATARMFRPTFGDSLNSYAAARLLADKPYLVQGSCCGGLTENKRLLERFETVGDACEGASIGHLASSGSGALVRGHQYGERIIVQTQDCS